MIDKDLLRYAMLDVIGSSRGNENPPEVQDNITAALEPRHDYHTIR